MELKRTCDYFASPPRRQIESVPNCSCCVAGRSVPLIFERLYTPESTPITPGQEWAVFHKDKLTEHGFCSRQEADVWLDQKPTWPLWTVFSDTTNEERGWRGPIPIVEQAKAKERFKGPYLRDCPPPLYSSRSDLSHDLLEDCLGKENFSPTFKATSDLELNFPLQGDQLRHVLQRAESYMIPNIECRLAEGWGFDQVLADVRRLPFHSGAIKADDALSQFRSVAIELEICLLRTFPKPCVKDVFHFWTSLQLYRHLADISKSANGRYSDPSNFNIIIQRWIGSYAALLLPPVHRDETDTAVTSTSSHEKRGRQPNQGRRDVIHAAIFRHGNSWRDHLDEILKELDDKNVLMGVIGHKKLDLGDGVPRRPAKWQDLNLTEGRERKAFVDALRKYAPIEKIKPT